MSALHDDVSAGAGIRTGEGNQAPIALCILSGTSVSPEIDASDASVAFYRERAQVLRLCGRWTEAVEAARKAIALDPNDPYGRNLLVDILLERGEYADVIEETASWLSLQPYNPAALEALAKAYWFKGDIDAALRTMHRLLRLSPYDPNYRFQRGVLYQYKGAWGLAMEDFLAVLSSRCPDRLRERAEQAAASLEHWQLRLIGMLLLESAPFRREFQVDPEICVAGRGFRLTEAGVAVLRSLPQDFDPDSGWVQAAFRHE
jgi:tetratricopeptide (TPR) repeat protein